MAPPAEPLIAEAVAAANASDVVVVSVGLSPDLEGEALSISVPGFVGGDRTDIALPFAQQRLIAALKATGKPIVLVLTSGSAVALDPANADAILAAWYPGESGGTAIADTLAGRNNPSGRLPVTFYANTTDLPAFVDYGMKERTYRYFTGTPTWGFGHGLSYTSYGYTAPVARVSVAAGQSTNVQVRVANTGGRDGEEVVQAYLVPTTAAAAGGPPRSSSASSSASPALRCRAARPAPPASRSIHAASAWSRATARGRLSRVRIAFSSAAVSPAPRRARGST